jgi:hypothetical protein
MVHKGVLADPEVNTRIEGTLEPSDYGMKFKKAFSGSGGGGFRPRDPKESAAIQRQHSQGCAVALLHVKAIAGSSRTTISPRRRSSSWRTGSTTTSRRRRAQAPVAEDCSRPAGSQRAAAHRGA